MSENKLKDEVVDYHEVIGTLENKRPVGGEQGCGTSMYLGRLIH